MSITPPSVDVPRRILDPDALLQPNRLQSLPASRISAGRSLLEKMQRERWTFERVALDIDERAEGEALYRVDAGGGRVFDFVVFSFEPSMEGRTGRITGVNWDMMGALIEGPTTPEDRAQTRAELPKLYAGRAVPGTLTWARSNRSFRAFDHAAEALAEGRQPDTRALWEVGYLMRNTGLDGNGTFLTRSFLTLDAEHPLRLPLHAQLLSAYIMREFAADLVETMARHRSADAVPLDRELRRMIGIGNGSALGLLFFVNTHPMLIGTWLEQRQTLLAEATLLPLAAGAGDAEAYLTLLERAADFARVDPYVYARFEDPADVARDLDRVVARLRELLAAGTTSGAELLTEFDGAICDEAWELAAANLLELLPYERVSAAIEGGIRAEQFVCEPTMPLAELRGILDRDYRWALETDMERPGAREYVWYKSADAEEPRRGPASEVDGGRNWALDLPGDVQRVDAALRERREEPATTVGELLREHPELRAAIERIQSLRGYRYHSPHMNMLADDFVPVSIVRFMNSAVHGLLRTVDEGDDRNVLGLIYLGAPTAADLNEGLEIETRYPQMPRAAEAQTMIGAGR
ncbi:hypothetical protein MUN78_13610 [Leucobacter allii]|uniref:Uncharacterized protein n=1 Tax=Leucobacter allii TaxID=2932247 RepID=A0ABY4FKM4_9MICO|nr:hypothetical protein [Leucobacter allii]UOQ56696.1 hypothetical protein MUN78_13610 [Leucobacter allii]